MGLRTQRVSDEILIEAYSRLKSCQQVAKEIGFCHQSVHERLKKLGVQLNDTRFTEAERQVIIARYAAHADAGTLDVLAKEMGRDKTTICGFAKKLGLTDQKRKCTKHATWKYLTEAEAEKWWKLFKRQSKGMIAFCKAKGIDDLGFSTCMKKYFGDEWEGVIESKHPKQSLYRYGRQFEYQVRDMLKERGYFAMRSPASKSPIDLLAVKTGTVLFVQCKRHGALGVKEWNDLFDLAESVGAIAVLAEKPTYKGAAFHRLIDRKDGSKRAQPMEHFEP